MKLEQQMYNLPKIGKERIYTIGNLENLSATALYYGEGGGSSGFSGGIGGGFGGIGKKECDKYGIVKTPLMKDNTEESLTIRDFPASKFQLHIHEQAGGKAHIWDYGRKNKIEINSYDAAMGDLLADKFDIVKILKRLGKI